MKKFTSELKKLKKNESGSFTLEASLLFPILLILTISLIFFSLVIYEKVELHQRAQLMADRMAYSWGNSGKDPATGSFDKYTSDADSNDGLYWRLFGNNILSKFGLDLGNKSADIAIGSRNSSSLPDRKLSRIPKSWLPAGATGTIQFWNNFAGGKIVVHLHQTLSLPATIKKILGISVISTNAYASVSDPVEFIRDTDLVVHYAEALKNNPIRGINIFRKK